MNIKTLQIKLSEKEYKKLSNAKEEAKILGLVKDWREFILMLARVK